MFHDREKAQGIVEFALTLPILLVLLLGIIEAGRLLFIYSAVNSASREAARYGSAAGEVGSFLKYYQDCGGIRDAAKRVGILTGIDDADILISYDHGPGTTVFQNACPPAGDQWVVLGDRIIVQVNATFEPIVPLVNFPPIPISSISRRTILKDVEIVAH
jgi:hypothetical protein